MIACINVIVTLASSSIIMRDRFRWFVDKAAVQFIDTFFIVSDKYDDIDAFQKQKVSGSNCVYICTVALSLRLL